MSCEFSPHCKVSNAAEWRAKDALSAPKAAAASNISVYPQPDGRTNSAEAVRGVAFDSAADHTAKRQRLDEAGQSVALEYEGPARYGQPAAEVEVDPDSQETRERVPISRSSL